MFVFYVLCCSDVDECAEEVDECSNELTCSWLPGRDVCRPVATCTNTHGSYHCTCASGYTGDGRVCIGIIIYYIYYTPSHHDSLCLLLLNHWAQRGCC